MELNQDQISKILQGIRIPPQPQILVDLQMEQVMPDPDLSRIAELIQQDAGLSGTILKMVNSSFFGLRNRIDSIPQAVNLIGMNSIINLVNGLSIKSRMNDETIVQLHRFWDTTTDIAQVSLQLARQVGYPNADLAYLLGLFHNVGIPLMLTRFDNYVEVMEDSYSQPDKRPVDVENCRLNSNHAVVGYFTAKSWNLPRLLCEAIADHHSAARHFGSDQVADSELRTLLAILKMAEHICGNYRILGRQKEDLEWYPVADSVLTYLGLGHYDLEQMQQNYDDFGCISDSEN